MANQILLVPTRLDVGTNFQLLPAVPALIFGTGNTYAYVQKYLFGDNNVATGVYGRAVAFGDTNTLYGANFGGGVYSFGNSNIVNADGFVGSVNIAFGHNNAITTGDAQTTFGISNTNYGKRGIVAGNSNTMTANVALCEESFIFGKSCYMSDASYNLLAGESNSIYKTNHYNIVAGQGNVLTDNSGALHNAVFGQNNIVNGGDMNLVAGGDATTATTVTGSNNIVAGGIHTVSGSFDGVFGNSNSVIGNLNIVGGFANQVNGTQSIVTGDQTISYGNRNLVIGRLLTTYGNNGIIVGETTGNGTGTDSCFSHGLQASCANNISYASAKGATVVARNTGQHAIATGRFTYNGDAQHSVLTLRKLTTDDTATEMPIDNGSTYLAIEDGKAYAFEATIVCVTATTGANRAMYKLKWHTFRGAGVGTTTVNGLVVETIYESDAGLDATVTADTTNGRPAIKVTGIAATNIRWVAKVEMTEVGYS